MKKLIVLSIIGSLTILVSCNQNSKAKNKEAFTTSKTDTTTKKSPEGKEFNLYKDISAFIPKNYSVLDSIPGDLNLDGLNDLILVLKKNNEKETSDVSEHPEKRPLLILLGDKNNNVTQVKRNDNTVYCVDCGGVMGDPYQGITIKNGYFSVEHYGGSNWRWSRIITYKYSKENKEWYLYKDGHESYHTSEPDKVETTIRTSKDFGKIKFEEFDIYKEDY